MSIAERLRIINLLAFSIQVYIYNNTYVQLCMDCNERRGRASEREGVDDRELGCKGEREWREGKLESWRKRSFPNRETHTHKFIDVEIILP